MPRMKFIPRCVQCERNKSVIWRSIENGEICNDCYEQNLKIEQEHPENENSNGNGDDKNKTRKSTRTTRFKQKALSLSGKTNLKGRNRRGIFKKAPFKAPKVSATTNLVESLFYKGTYMQVGDIVSLMDAKDNIYYAQIQALLMDTYCEKSAFITWLIPTMASPNPNERFDPSTYLIGPSEESPRELSSMEFIMHAPSNYYYDETTPYPPPDCMDFESQNTGFIWTSLAEFDRNKSKIAVVEKDEPVNPMPTGTNV